MVCLGTEKSEIKDTAWLIQRVENMPHMMAVACSYHATVAGGCGSLDLCAWARFPNHTWQMPTTQLIVCLGNQRNSGMEGVWCRRIQVAERAKDWLSTSHVEPRGDSWGAVSQWQLQGPVGAQNLHTNHHSRKHLGLSGAAPRGSWQQPYPDSGADNTLQPVPPHTVEKGNSEFLNSNWQLDELHKRRKVLARATTLVWAKHLKTNKQKTPERKSYFSWLTFGG